MGIAKEVKLRECTKHFPPWEIVGEELRDLGISDIAKMS